MPTCCVLTCKHGYWGHITPPDVRWLLLPKDESLKRQWLFRIHRANEEKWVSKKTAICSYHFTEDDWIPDSENKDSRGRPRQRKRLKSNAIPSVNLRPPREQKGTHICQ